MFQEWRKWEMRLGTGHVKLFGDWSWGKHRPGSLDLQVGSKMNQDKGQNGIGPGSSRSMMLMRQWTVVGKRCWGSHKGHAELWQHQ